MSAGYWYLTSDICDIDDEGFKLFMEDFEWMDWGTIRMPPWLELGGSIRLWLPWLDPLAPCALNILVIRVPSSRASAITSIGLNFGIDAVNLVCAFYYSVYPVYLS